MSRPAELSIPSGSLRAWHIACLASVIYAGLCAEIWRYVLELPDPHGWVAFFSLSDEANLPTWFASMQLLACAGATGLAAVSTRRSAGRGVAHWWGLSAAFVYISIDESVQIHEHLNQGFDGAGILYFGWVIPAGIFVAAFGLAYLRFLAILPRSTRRGVVLAGALFVGGALGVELALGYWTDHNGDGNLVYALIDWTEESLELCGIALMLEVVSGHLGRLLGLGEVGLRITADAPRSRPVFPLLIGCTIAAVGAASVAASGLSTVYVYADRGGRELIRSHDLGEDLSGEMRGGHRFTRVGTRRLFDRNVEVRSLLVFALGAGAVLLSVASATARFTTRNPSGNISPASSPSPDETSR